MLRVQKLENNKRKTASDMCRNQCMTEKTQISKLTKLLNKNGFEKTVFQSRFPLQF